MIRAVGQGNFHVGDREAGNWSGFQSLPHAFLHGRVEVAWHRSAEHLFAEFELGVRERLQFEEDVTILTRATGLLLVLVLSYRLCRDRLAVGHAGKAELDVDAKPA